MKKKQNSRCEKQSSKALYFNQKLELCYLSNLLETVKMIDFREKIIQILQIISICTRKICTIFPVSSRGERHPPCRPGLLFRTSSLPLFIISISKMKS